MRESRDVLQYRLDRARDAIHMLEGHLRTAGWKQWYAGAPVDTLTYPYMWAPGASTAQVRRDTLAAVIRALGIEGYGEGRGDSSNIDRFWADIQTALEVRAERERQAERDATEARVRGLAAAVLEDLADLAPASTDTKENDQ